MHLTRKASITIAADETFCDIFPNFWKKIRYDISFESPAGDSHEMSCLINFCYF